MRILYCILFCFSLSAAASETVRWKSQPDGTLEFWSLHADDGLFVLDRFEKRTGEFQDLVEHKAFSDPALAHREYNRLTQGFHRHKAPLLLLNTFSLLSEGQIWPTTNQWSWDWEQKFADWMSNEVSPGYFQAFGISTDCADAAYALRWIFARINGLPAGNHLSISAQLFTNETMLPEWQNLSTAANWQDDQRFRAALDYLLRNTYTHSLMGDLYPVKITRAAALPGTIFLHLYSSETGHTELLYQVKESNHPAPLRMLASNVPRTVRELAEYGMQDWGSPPTQGQDGLLRFRWTIKSPEGWSMVPAPEMPNYSLEQYDPKFMQGFDSFVDAVTKKIIPDWKPSSAAVMREKVKLLLDRLKARVQIVSDGFDFCLNNHGCAQGSAEWENWSTPSRDAAIGRIVQDIYGLHGGSMCSPGCEGALSDARKVIFTELRSQPYSAGNAIDTWIAKRYNSDPNAPVTERWGL